MTPATSVHYRSCNLCEAMCGVRIEVEDGKVSSIRGDEDDPLSHGYICPKAVALKDLHEDPDRLRHPMRRTANGWEQIEWDEALDEVARRLHDIQTTHGRDAVAVYQGNPNVHNMGAMLFGPGFLRTLKSKRRFSATSVDQLPHMLASYLMLGHQLLLPIPDIDRTRYFLVLGANPLASNGSLMSAPGMRDRIAGVRARGGRVVVIDPRRTETALAADEHVFIRPGKDALFLLALLNVLFAAGSARLGRLESITDGMETLRDVVREWTPERVAPHTGVPSNTIVRIARELAAAESAVVYGRVGTSTQEFGALCQWLIYALNIVTGNFDRAGGAMFPLPAVDVVGMPRSFAAGRGGFGRFRSRVRGLPEFGGELPVVTLAEEILTEGEGKIRALVTIAGNPVLSTPNGANLDRALGALDFMVAVDPYLNETTRHANIILPPPSPLERAHYDVIFHLFAVRNTARYAPALFDPGPSARHDWQILLGLTHRLETLRARNARERLASALKTRALEAMGPEGMLEIALLAGKYGRRPFRRGVDLRALRASPHGVDLGPLEPALPERLKGRRINLAPRELVEDLARLRTSLAERAPELVLIGRRHLRDNNSWMHNVERLVKGRPRCTLLVHPDDAQRLGLADGADALVRSRVGEVRVPVSVSDEIMPGVVSLPHGYGHARPGVRLSIATQHAGVSVNDLTDERSVDALSGNAALSGVPVEVQPAP